MPIVVDWFSILEPIWSTQFYTMEEARIGASPDTIHKYHLFPTVVKFHQGHVIVGSGAYEAVRGESIPHLVCVFISLCEGVGPNDIYGWQSPHPRLRPSDRCRGSSARRSLGRRSQLRLLYSIRFMTLEALSMETELSY